MRAQLRSKYLRGRDQLAGLGVDGKVILNYVLIQYRGVIWIILVQLKVEYWPVLNDCVDGFAVHSVFLDLGTVIIYLTNSTNADHRGRSV
jgi:hypothetical protein